MRVNNTLFVMIIVLFVGSCSNKTEDKKFTVAGSVNGASDQKVMLEELYFTRQPPSVVDTAIIKNGKFSLSAISEEEGMYRIRFEKPELAYIFINDAKEIKFKADLNGSGLESADFKTKANSLLKNFLIYIQTQSNNANAINSKIEQLKTTKSNDSAIAAENKNLQESFETYKNFIVQFVDTVSDPVVAMFALGYSQGVEESKLKPVIAKLETRFSHHNGMTTLIREYNKVNTTEQTATPTISSQGPAIGIMAPELTMNDVDGKSFSLSSLKGKYVLVDFWASWCGPCRRENPNVVAAYNKYKNKNFTVLGVSLDQEKDAWINAIKQDKLTWKHISDLKYWNSAAVSLYGFDGIPFNVLVDPSGKIIAKELRESDLDKTLSQVLK